MSFNRYLKWTKVAFSLTLISIQIARTAEPGTTRTSYAKISSELREKFSMQNPWLLSESITAEWVPQSDAPPVFPNLCPFDLLLVPPIKILEKETGGSAKNHPRFKKNLIPFSLTISNPAPHWFWGFIYCFLFNLDKLQQQQRGQEFGSPGENYSGTTQLLVEAHGTLEKKALLWGMVCRERKLRIGGWGVKQIPDH